MKIEVINISSNILELLLKIPSHARNPSHQVEEARMRSNKEKEELKTKLASSTSNYKELVGKFEVFFANLNVELTSKLEKLEASANTPTKAPKRISLFDIIKKDSSTSCIDLIELDSPKCNQQVCVENVIV